MRHIVYGYIFAWSLLAMPAWAATCTILADGETGTIKNDNTLNALLNPPRRPGWEL